ncbi:MAG: ketol-acid reductoisomerase, partial [Nitrososphaerales archaeon]
PRVIDDNVKKKMKQVLSDIQSGQFAEEWVSIYEKEGKVAFERYMKQLEQHQVEQVGKKIRKMMWPKEPEV